MGAYGTGRPPTERDTLHVLNGAPTYLGALVSTGAAVNNATTATPFASPASPVGQTIGGNPLIGTLAGRMLLLQPTAAGLILASPSASVGVPGVTTVALQTVLPPAGGTAPGFLLATAGVAAVVLMPSNMGWLQWLPLSGSANLIVFELT